MEVHHHPHVEKKSFKEYLLEGLMIFVAVSFGFIAENIRESISDTEKEEAYIESFVQNLRDDSVHLAAVIEENTAKIAELRELMKLSQQNLSAVAVRKELYNYCSSAVGYYSLFTSNNATLQQLKNSGGLRLIRRNHASDSIASYDVEIQGIYGAGSMYKAAKDAGVLASQELLDYTAYYDSMYFSNGKFTDKLLPLLSTDPIKLKLFFNKVDFEIGATQNYLDNLKQRQPFMTRLIVFLNKLYHLE